MKFTEEKIIALYTSSLKEAAEKLSLLAVAEGRRPNLRGLNGWVFEQTIRYCLSDELTSVGLQPQMQDQITLRGRAKVDLLVGKVAVELKVGGIFGAGDLKYEGYRKAAVARGWVYIYLTLGESHPPFRQRTETMFGRDCAFFLDMLGDWKRFVDTVIANHV